MNWKALALGASIGFLFALVPSCGQTKCSTANCKGCCDSAGKCIETANQSASACGANGAACAACTTGATCSAGVCQGGTGGGGGGGGTGGGGGGGGTTAGCGPGTTNPCTNGCCSGTGPTATCLLGTSNNNCGKGGAQCQACTTGQTCSNQTCTGSTATKQVGDPCTQDSDCASITDGGSAVCKKQTSSGNATYPGGYCTVLCENAECPAGSFCVSGVDGYGESDLICWRDCSDDQTACRSPGYTCYGLSSGGGACWLDPLPAPLDAGPPADKVGFACATHADCQNPPDNGECIMAAQPDGGPSGFQDGYCTAQCFDNDHCGDGGVCISFNNGLNACLASCNPAGTQAGCRTGYVCDFLAQLPDGGMSPDGICWPNCNNPGAGCPQGQTCQSNGFCQ